MIYAFTGKTGSGKTFQMAKLAHKHWCGGRDIYSNTPLSFDIDNSTGGYSIIDRPKEFSLFEHMADGVRSVVQKNYKPKSRGRIVYFEDISEILEAQDGMIVFDEAQALFWARNWENIPAEFIYKLQQHRKHKLDMVCTTQNMATIEISYRRLVQEWWHCQDLLSVGDVFLGLFKMKKKDVDELYTSVDDLQVSDVGQKHFLIGFWCKRLFNTNYDIGFNRFKIVWENYLAGEKMKMRKQVYIIPKNSTLKSAKTYIASLKSSYGKSK